jgi:signal transduction histidine kinase/sensor domain CHASE-containing protein
LIAGLAAISAIGSGFIVIDITENAAFKATQRVQIAERATYQINAIKNVFAIHIGALNALEGLVKTQPDLPQAIFKGVARALIQKHPTIRQIQLSPNAVIRYLHPTHTKDKARGLDLRALPGQKEDVEQSIRDGLIKTVGPLTLAQGGEAVITRNPIYIGEGQGRKFWGFATIILDYPNLLKELQASLEAPHVYAFLKTAEANGQKGKSVFGNENPFLLNGALIRKIDIPGAQWVLAVAPQDGWATHRPGRWLFLTMALMASVLCGALAYWDTSRRIALKFAEREAAEKSALLEGTFRNMAQGIAVYDADHTLIAFNPQYAEISGLPSDFLYVGMGRRDILRYREEQKHFDETDDETWIEERLAGAEQPESRERTLPNGVSYTYQRTPMPDGGYITAVTDDTDRKRLEAGLEEARKFEAIGQLAGGTAHEFNNLLMGMTGPLEILRDKLQENEGFVSRIDKVLASSRRAASLVSGLLSFAQRQYLDLEAVDVGNSVKEALTYFSQNLKEGVELNVNLAPNLSPAKTDRNQFETALINLIFNANDAIPANGHITVEAGNVVIDRTENPGPSELPAGNYVSITVTDTGVGMTTEALAHAPQPFYTNKGTGRGTGLGLSMVHGFTKQSGGEFFLESEEGKGTKATLILPAADSTNSEPA